MTLSDIATSARLPRLPLSNFRASPLTRLAKSLQQAPRIHTRSSCGQYKQESFSLNSDVLALAFRPDGKEIAVSTLDGQITFFDI